MCETPVVSTPPPTPEPTTQPPPQPPISGAPPTPEPTPRIILVTPVGTATPFPTPTLEPTYDPDATPVPTPAPTPVSTPPATVAGDIDPPTVGECLHCWIYNSPVPLPDDAEYDLTERFLRERYEARSARVVRCGTCPMVFGRHNIQNALRFPLYPMAAGKHEVRSLHERVAQKFTELIENRLSAAIANGWVVPISATHHIRDVAGMIAWPLQPYPRHEPGAWALTWDGYEEITPREIDTSVPAEDLSALRLDTECAVCWRYPDGLDPRMRDFTEQHLAEVFPNGDSTAPACDTCPWMYDGSDLTAAIAGGSLAVVRSGPATYITFGHPVPRLIDAAILRRPGYADYITDIGPGYSANQVARMIDSFGRGAARFYGPGTKVVTNLGMRAIQQAALNPPVPYTPVFWGSPPPAKADLPLQFCVADLGSADDTAHLLAITGEAISRWNIAVDVTALSLTGTCAADISVASGNSRNEVSVVPGEEDYADGRASLTGNERDVTISSRVLNVTGRNVDVLTHEFGHVLGFDHSGDPRSRMYGGSETASQAAAASIQDWEVALLREIWGFD